MGIRRALPPRAQLPLHQNRVEPAAMFETNGLECADQAKAQARMQPDRSGIFTVTDGGEHLAPGTCFATGKQDCQQGFPNAAASATLGNVDAVFDGVAVGRAWSVA